VLDRVNAAPGRIINQIFSGIVRISWEPNHVWIPGNDLLYVNFNETSCALNTTDSVNAPSSFNQTGLDHCRWCDGEWRTAAKEEHGRTFSCILEQGLSVLKLGVQKCCNFFGAFSFTQGLSKQCQGLFDSFKTFCAVKNDNGGDVDLFELRN